MVICIKDKTLKEEKSKQQEATSFKAGSWFTMDWRLHPDPEGDIKASSWGVQYSGVERLLILSRFFIQCRIYHQV